MTSESLLNDSGVIPAERKALLEELSIYIKQKLHSEKEVSLMFICANNSRRSLMAQIWAQAAAEYFNISGIKTFSGGTHKTAFNTSAINALKKAGFKISILNEEKNPKYKVQFAKNVAPVICFSKVYNYAKNPKDGFVAIMTCSDADEACPVVEGAQYRTSIKYENPKKYDRTEKETEAYEERSLQIGREMLFVFSHVGTS